MPFDPDIAQAESRRRVEMEAVKKQAARLGYENDLYGAFFHGGSEGEPRRTLSEKLEYYRDHGAPELQAQACQDLSDVDSIIARLEQRRDKKARDVQETEARNTLPKIELGSGYQDWYVIAEERQQNSLRDLSAALATRPGADDNDFWDRYFMVSLRERVRGVQAMPENDIPHFLESRLTTYTETLQDLISAEKWLKAQKFADMFVRGVAFLEYKSGRDINIEGLGEAAPWYDAAAERFKEKQEDLTLALQSDPQDPMRFWQRYFIIVCRRHNIGNGINTDPGRYEAMRLAVFTPNSGLQADLKRQIDSGDYIEAQKTADILAQDRMILSQILKPIINR